MDWRGNESLLSYKRRTADDAKGHKDNSPHHATLLCIRKGEYGSGGELS